MRKKLVYICSPYRGDYKGAMPATQISQNIDKARAYCAAAMKKWPDVVPIAPHLLFTQFLDDTKTTERSLGLAAGIALLDMCDEIWVFGLDNPSEGMKAEIEYANEHEIPIKDGFKMLEEAEQPEEEMGDALLVIPTPSINPNGVAAFESTTLRISGEVVVELAKAIRRNRRIDVEVEL